MISLVLCAGLGTRLRPITLKWPKPLVPMWSDTLKQKITPAELQIEKLTQLNTSLVASIDHKICLNSHYLSDQVQELGDSHNHVSKVFYEEEILGTAGPLSSLYDSLKESENFSQGLLVVNGDIYHELDLYSFVSDSISSGCEVALLAKNVPGVNSLCIDKQSNLVALKGRFGDESLTRKNLTFCGVSWYSEEALKRLCLEERDIREFWHSQLKYSESPIKVFEQKGYWEDIGSFEGLFTAQNKWLASLGGGDSNDKCHFLEDSARQDFENAKEESEINWTNVWVYSKNLSKEVILQNPDLNNALVIDDLVWKLDESEGL